MRENNIRLVSTAIYHFKNVSYGKIDMPCAIERDFSCDHAEILGIYGQNGSGKTTVIDAIDYAKALLRGKPLPAEAAGDIAKTSETASCEIAFFIGDDGEGILAEYAFTIKRRENSAYVSSEKLSYRTVSENRCAATRSLLSYEADRGSAFLSPKNKRALLIQNEDDAVELAVARKLSERNGTSFFFSADTVSLLMKNADALGTDGEVLKRILAALPSFAAEGLFVINSDHSGVITLGAAMPFSLHFDGDEETPDNMMLSLTAPSVQPMATFELLRFSVTALNRVLGALIPGMRLEILEYGGQMTPDGKEGMRFEILSVRGENRIPLKNESEGIKKIISILSILIAMYNNPSVCVAVDEFDAGVYEYLLGELLGILKESGKGQLIFTSHNLRPLEMIDKKDIVFTTTNPDNRYIRLSGVRGNNLRDIYIRSIHIGGQKEELYGYTNPLEIARAFRLAGRDGNGK